jgi:hypothetical protein
MSAIYSFVYSDRVHVLTDGGFFHEDGVLAGVRRKLFASDTFPLVIACRGRPAGRIAEIVGEMESYFERHAVTRSMDACLAAIGDYFRELQARSDPFEAEFLLAAFSETGGPCHFFIHCHGRYDFPAFSLCSLGNDIQAGPPVSLDDLAAVGVTTPDIVRPDFPPLHGATLMQIARRKLEAVPETGMSMHLVGGHCELATVSADGVEIRTLCRWPDEIGKPIDPTLERMPA